MSNATGIRHLTVLCVAAVLLGCSPSTQEPPHEHAAPAHMPRNLADLARKIRSRIERLKAGQDAKASSQLADLIGWTAEIAADTEIGEKRWNPIYELSESLRLEINETPEEWGSERREKAEQLCQLVEEAWKSLAPGDRVDRYLGHDHEHGGHGHDHDHGHDHSDDPAEGSNHSASVGGAGESDG